MSLLPPLYTTDIKSTISLQTTKVPVTKNVTGKSIHAVPPYLACTLFFLYWLLLTDTCVPSNALQRLQPNISFHHPHSLERFTTLLHRIYYTHYCSNIEGVMSILICT